MQITNYIGMLATGMKGEHFASLGTSKCLYDSFLGASCKPYQVHWHAPCQWGD